MKYIEALRKFWRDYNPFIHIKPEEIVDESENFIILGARAPYAEPFINNTQRQVYLLKELTWIEKNEMWKLLENGQQNYILNIKMLIFSEID